MHSAGEQHKQWCIAKRPGEHGSYVNECCTTRALQPNTGMEAQLPEYRNSFLACRPRCRTRGSSHANKHKYRKAGSVTKTPPHATFNEDERGNTAGHKRNAIAGREVQWTADRVGWVGHQKNGDGSLQRDPNPWYVRTA